LPHTRLPTAGALPTIVLVALPTNPLSAPTSGPTLNGLPEASSITLKLEEDRVSVPPVCRCRAIAAAELLGVGVCCNVAVILALPVASTSDTVTVACAPLTVPENEG